MSINVGDLHFTLEARGNLDQDLRNAETRGRQLDRTLQDTTQTVERLGNQSRDAAVQAVEGYRASANAAEELGIKARQSSRVAEEAQEKATKAARDYNAMVARGGASQDEIRQALRRTEAAQDSARQATIRAERANEQYEASFREAARAADRAGEQIGDAMRDAARETERAGDQAGDGFRSRLESGLGGMESMASHAGASMGGGFIAGFGPKIAGLASKGGPIALALGSIAVLGVGIGAALADAIADGMESTAQKDKIQAQLGVNDATMAVVAKAAANSYTDAWGESMQGNREALRDAILSGMLTGEESTPEMEKALSGLLATNDLIEGDVKETSRAVAQMMKTDVVGSYEEGFDLIAKANQKGLNQSGDLIESINEYSTQFRQVGLSAKEGMGLVSQAVAAGARDTDVAVDAIKEFGIRAQDGSEASAEAYETIGLNAEEMTRKVAEGGVGANDALDQVLQGLRNIEDPVKRNAAAVGLFGTQAEDLGDALYAMDLGKARREWADMAGTAERAAQTMGDNAASKIISAQREIEVASQTMKEGLAEAFAPMLGDAATWVSAHKPEIIAFFTDVGVAALDLVIAGGKATVGFLRHMADMQRGVGQAMGNMIDWLGDFSGFLGKVMSVIPGMEDDAQFLEALDEKTEGLGQRAVESGDRLDGMADKIENNLIPALEKGQYNLEQTGADAAASAELFRALGDTVTAVPTEHGIEISENTPEVAENLKALGLKITTLPDGTFIIEADTQAGQDRIDAFYDANDGRIIRMDVQTRSINPLPDSLIVPKPTTGPRASGAAPYTPLGAMQPNADGNVYNGGQRVDQQAHITDRPTILFGEPETHGEAYVPFNPAKRERSTRILSTVAGKFGYGLMAMADGGVLESLQSIQQRVAPELTLTSGLRQGDSGHHGTGNAGDFSNGSGNTEAQLRFAKYMGEHYGPQLAELIYDDPAFTGQEIKNGAKVDSSFYDGAGDHTNHVHVATLKPLTDDGGAAEGGLQQTAVDPNSKQGIANKIIAEGKRRGMSDKEIKSAVMAGLAESDLQNLEYGDRDSLGVMQQRPSQGWGTEEQIMDPDYAIGKYYDALEDVPGREDMSEAQMAQAVQRSGFADGSNYQAKSDEADSLIASAGASSSSDSGTSASDASSTSGVQDVRVTNWPDSLGAAGSTETREDTARARLQVAMYANGGTVGGSGFADTEPALLTPLEEVTPRDMAIKHRRLLKAIAADRVPAYADGGTVGGFGGYKGKPTDTKKMNWNDWAGLAAGAGFFLASGFNDQGGFKGFDTGSTSIPGMDAALEQLKEIASKPTIVVEKAEIKTDNPQQFGRDLMDMAGAQLEITRRNL